MELEVGGFACFCNLVDSSCSFTDGGEGGEFFVSVRHAGIINTLVWNRSEKGRGVVDKIGRQQLIEEMGIRDEMGYTICWTSLDLEVNSC